MVEMTAFLYGLQRRMSADIYAMCVNMVLKFLREYEDVERIQEFGCEAIRHVAEKCKGDVKRE
jgi:hypothetical protein